MTEGGHGLEALKRLYNEYRPQAAVSKHKLLAAATQPQQAWGVELLGLWKNQCPWMWAIGWYRPKCDVCGKLGQHAKDCWSGKDKGGKSKSGKGEGNKGGKNAGKKGAKGNSITCRYCGKQGHIERECWQKHGRPQKGRVQSVEEDGAERGVQWFLWR
eukprot:1235540-Amphidinium_carterae.2